MSKPFSIHEWHRKVAKQRLEEDNRRSKVKVTPQGNLVGFRSIDDEEGEGTTEWLAGLQRVINFLRSIPKLKELSFTEPMVRIVKELEMIIGIYIPGSEERQKLLDSIPGDTIGQKAEMAALGTIMHKHDMIFNIHVMPYLEKLNPDLPGLMDDEDDLFEGLKSKEFDPNTLKAVGRKIDQLGLMKEAEVDADGNLVGFSPPNWRMRVSEYDHIHFYIKRQDAGRLQDELIRAGIDMVDDYPFGRKHLLRVSLGIDPRGDLQKAEKIVGQRARKDSPETNWRMRMPEE